MAKDKYSAVWISYSSIQDYLRCPRLYYLRNLYKDPKTGHKITVMQPSLALGQAVHDVIEGLSALPVEFRLNESIFNKFEEAWKNVSGKRGGFTNSAQEAKYKERGRAMIQRILNNPGPIARKAIKIKQDLPHYWLSEEDNIVLCGKIDWLEYVPSKDGVKIIDFKTGKNEEDGSSLQLPIYSLLVANCQSRPAIGAGYWYLERDGEIKDVDLPSQTDAYNKVIEIAKRIALARKLDHLKCQYPGGCAHCQQIEAVAGGRGELVGVSNYNQDIYIL
jgi:ATP-dependent helicase/DNAse subunit B